MCHLPVRICADARSNGEEPPLFQELREAAHSSTAMALFGIQGKKSASDTSEDRWSFASSFNCFVQNASGTTKGRLLEERAGELAASQAEAVPQSVLQSRKNDQSENYTDVQAIETSCAFFKSISEKTQIESIESSNTYWQINWCRVCPPEKGDQICSNDNTRLWMQVSVLDDSGKLNIYIREKAALSLAGLENKEEFEAALANDTLEFPNKASIKIIRKPAEPGMPATQESAQKPARVNCFIVEAGERFMEVVLFNLQPRCGWTGLCIAERYRCEAMQSPLICGCTGEWDSAAALRCGTPLDLKYVPNKR